MNGLSIQHVHAWLSCQRPEEQFGNSFLLVLYNMVMLLGVQKYTRAYLHCLVMIEEAMGSHLLSSQFIVYDEGITLNYQIWQFIFVGFV
jgi:hypothetical protein